MASPRSSACRLVVAIALFCAKACLPMPPASEPATSSDTQTGVPFSDANNNQNTAGVSPREPFSAAQGSMTISAATAPDLCLTVAEPSATSSALVLRNCDASIGQRFVLVNGYLQSANGNCVLLTPGLLATGGEVAMTACDANSPNQIIVFNGGNLGVSVPAGNLVLQSDRNPASTQSFVSFSLFRANAPQQQWALAQASHDNQQALVANGTHLVTLDSIHTCLTGSLNALTYADCSPASPNQAFTMRSDGLLQVGAQCVSVRSPAPILVNCDPNAAAQRVGWTSGLLFNGNGLCIDRDAAQPTMTASKPCDFVSSPHFIVGLSQ